MRLAGACLGIWVAVGPCAAQTDLTPELLLLARIKVHMSETLARLPNYTCVQTIERSRRRAPSHRFELVDTLRLEVAMVGNKELFAWPGAGEFEDRDIRDMVPGGAIGNGNFGLHAYSVFLSNAPTYTYVGERTRDGRRTIRYNYRVSYINSGYKIRVPPNEATVAYHGSLWVDARTLDLVRLEVNADDIPPHLGIAEANDSIDYGRVRIADSDFLLPRAAELIMTDFSGSQSRNRTLFSDCRQFSGQSALSFGEVPAAGAPTPPKPVTETCLPAGLLLPLELETAIDSSNAYVGDPVTARLSTRVKRDGQILVPKGALARGRISRLEKRSSPYPHFILGLQFHTLEFDGHRASFTARLEDVGPSLIGFRSPGRERMFIEDELRGGRSVLNVPGQRLKLPRRFRMTWKTETQLAPEQP